jgi:cytidine deaminase
VFAAFASGAARKPMTAIAVVADTPAPASPCGACRQVMFESGGPDLRVIMANLRGEYRIVRMHELLPGGFQLDPQEAAVAAPDKAARKKKT